MIFPKKIDNTEAVLIITKLLEENGHVPHTLHKRDGRIFLSRGSIEFMILLRDMTKVNILLHNKGSNVVHRSVDYDLHDPTSLSRILLVMEGYSQIEKSFILPEDHIGALDRLGFKGIYSKL